MAMHPLNVQILLNQQFNNSNIEIQLKIQRLFENCTHLKPKSATLRPNEAQISEWAQKGPNNLLL